MLGSKATVVLVAVALVLGCSLAVPPAGDSHAGVAWLGLALLLLWRMARGGHVAAFILTTSTAFWAVVLLLSGAHQVSTDPRYLLQGVCFAIATAQLVRLRHVSQLR